MLLEYDCLMIQALKTTYVSILHKLLQPLSDMKYYSMMRWVTYNFNHSLHL